jgi:hypothetical protein
VMLLLPPPLVKLHDTPFLRSEMPSGFKPAAVLVLPADPRYHTLGSVRVDFKNAQTSESVSYALSTALLRRQPSVASRRGSAREASFRSAPSPWDASPSGQPGKRSLKRERCCDSLSRTCAAASARTSAEASRSA